MACARKEEKKRRTEEGAAVGIAGGNLRAFVPPYPLLLKGNAARQLPLPSCGPDEKELRARRASPLEQQACRDDWDGEVRLRPRDDVPSLSTRSFHRYHHSIKVNGHSKQMIVTSGSSTS